jgi:peptidyl-prolyl cis-trans isomerase A (cyclophilin A)
MKLVTPALLSLLLLASCTTAPEPKKAEEAAPPAKPQASAEAYKVRLDTSKGVVIVEVHPEWAPLGAERFRQLVEAGYYNGARFFRIVPNFVVQFGIAANPAMTKKWDKPFPDDPVAQTNRTGTLAFATMGPNTRTTQVFINLRANQTLDSDGFAPFARVVDGMAVVEKLYSGYGEAPDQGAITNRGNAYLNEKFPNLDYIKTATMM